MYILITFIFLTVYKSIINTNHIMNKSVKPKNLLTVGDY